MLNYINIVGRLVRKPHLGKSENGKSVATVTLAVPRSFKNMDGVYDTDFIDCLCWDNIAKNTSQYCDVGDIICVRGRLQSRVITENEINKNKLEVVAEKVTFLSSKKKKEEE